MQTNARRTRNIRFITPAIFIIVLSFIMVQVSHQNDEFENDHLFMGIILIQAISIIPMLIGTFRLRDLVADEEGITFDNGGRTISVPYNNMLWISRFDLYCPSGTTIKYRDSVSGEEKKVAFVTDKQPQKNEGTISLAAYIKKNIEGKSDFYDKVNAPSNLRNKIILTAIGLPLWIWAFYLIIIK